MGLESLGAAFEAFGYTQQDWYTFPAKHLLAAWYAPPPDLYDTLPRIFISQLQVDRLSRPAQVRTEGRVCKCRGVGQGRGGEGTALYCSICV
jgi:hypothetical protein